MVITHEGTLVFTSGTSMCALPVEDIGLAIEVGCGIVPEACIAIDELVVLHQLILDKLDAGSLHIVITFK